MTILLVFILGLVVGSFLNAVIFRLSSKESFLFNRSHCVSCGHELASRDLIPLFSFIMLAGRCRYCRARISWQYPLIELLTAIIFVLAAYSYRTDESVVIMELGFWFQLIMICYFIVIAVYDYKHYLILDKVVYSGLALSIIWNIFLDITGEQAILRGHFVSGALGAAVVSGFFSLQYLISKGRWIGFGDVKFGLLLGSLFGFTFSLVMLFLSYILGAVVGVGLILIKRKTMDSAMPFGVFLSASAIIMLLYGEQLTNWYLRLIGL